MLWSACDLTATSAALQGTVVGIMSVQKLRCTATGGTPSLVALKPFEQVDMHLCRWVVTLPDAFSLRYGLWQDENEELALVI